MHNSPAAVDSGSRGGVPPPPPSTPPAGDPTADHRNGDDRGPNGSPVNSTAGSGGRRKKPWFPALHDQYQEVCKSIIRPPRDYYDLENLGPPVFRIRQKIFIRRDLNLFNNKGQELKCSQFSPHPRHRKQTAMPCVVYLHGNCSSRLEALGVLHVLLPLNVNVFSFDFAGSGLSDGEYVSLGWHERDDLSTVIEHLRNSGEVSTIGLWGRSMGAVTALLHCHRDPSIACLVLDSPFSSLRKLATELTEFFVGWKLPKFLVNMVLNFIRTTILQKADFDINELEPIKYVSSTHMPAMFIAGKNDRFIQPHHSHDLRKAYNGEAVVHDIDGDHNTIRPPQLLSEVAMFFYERLQYEYCTQSLLQSCTAAANNYDEMTNVSSSPLQNSRSPNNSASPGPVADDGRPLHRSVTERPAGDPKLQNIEDSKPPLNTLPKSNRSFWNWFAARRNAHAHSSSDNKVSAMTHRGLGDAQPPRRMVGDDSTPHADDAQPPQRRASASEPHLALQQQQQQQQQQQLNSSSRTNTAPPARLEDVLLQGGGGAVRVDPRRGPRGADDATRARDEGVVSVISAKEWSTTSTRPQRPQCSPDSSSSSSDSDDLDVSTDLPLVMSPDTSTDTTRRGRNGYGEESWTGVGDDPRIGMRRPDLDCRIDSASVVFTPR